MKGSEEFEAWRLAFAFVLGRQGVPEQTVSFWGKEGCENWMSLGDKDNQRVLGFLSDGGTGRQRKKKQMHTISEASGRKGIEGGFFHGTCWESPVHAGGG
jgi:hypothetical protein